MTHFSDLSAGPGMGAQRLSVLRTKLAERGLLDRHEESTDAGESMSDAQRRMWFVHSADPTGILLNVCVAYRLTGAIDAEHLHTAVNAVASRHPSLRTTYPPAADGAPHPVEQSEIVPAWSVHNLSGIGAQARQLRLEVIARREFSEPFDLSTDSPLRITLVQTGPEEHVLVLVAHHIAWDDASWEVFFAELTTAYVNAHRNVHRDLRDAHRALRDAHRNVQRNAHRDLRNGDAGSASVGKKAQTVSDPPADLEADLNYWRELMSDLPDPLELPGPCGSAVPSTWRAQRCRTHLDAGTVERVMALASETGGTPYGVLLAVFSALLHRYTHADDFLVAVPVLDRGAAADGQIGYFGNTVALRMEPRSDQSFGDLVRAIRDVTLGAFAHQRITLDRVVAELNPDRRYGVERMARVSFGFREPDGPGFCPPGLRSERIDLRSPVAQLPLTAMIEFDGRNPAAGAEVEFEYLVEVLDSALAARILDSFCALLHSALAEPGQRLAQLTVLAPEEDEWLRQISHGEVFDVPAATIGELVSAQAARTPDEIAVVYEERRYTYRDVDLAANRVANWLIAQGVSTEDRVAVVLDKSPELVITALGILKAGAVYTPVDPTYPPDRIDYILSDCNAALIVREPVGDLDNHSADPPARRARADNTSYLIYTSGSTGLPKGVAVPHAPVAEYFRWFGEEYAVGNGDRLLQVASPSFDVSIGEIFGTLTCGARLVIPRPDGLRDIGYLTDLLQRERITLMHFVPSLLGLFLSLPGVQQWRTLRRVPIGGEALPGELADRFHAMFDALLHNFYGPTETVVNATRYPVEGRQGQRTVPIGRPKINTAVYLLDDSLQPVPVGVIGEIYIGGSHLAHGYHRRKALTAERFVADPFSAGGRLYRTGDLARRNSDGDLEFIGRADDQVKIRGFRIELGEVAAAVAVDPSVGQAAVVASDLPSLGMSLVAYVTPATGEQVDIARIKTRVAEALPDYMTPACYITVGEIPITPNGKIDRDALPEPQVEMSVEFDTVYREPAEGTERSVAALFERFLERGRIGADDSFFGLGGHSLLAVRMIATIRSEFGVDVDVREIFDHGSVAELASLIERRQAGEKIPPRTALVALPGDFPKPLSASQLRSWFAYRVEGPSPISNIPFAAELSGPCDVDALTMALTDVIMRHEILRTTYREIDGVPFQIVNNEFNNGAEAALRHIRTDDPAEVASRLRAERRHSFDLETEVPVHAALVSTQSIPDDASSAVDRHVLSLVVHHIAADHWSAGLLFGDLLTAYRARMNGKAPGWPPLAVQYGDYAAWQTELLERDGAIVTKQSAYWRKQLAGLPEASGLAADYPRPAVLSGLANTISFAIDATTRARLAALGRDVGATPFMLLQAAVAVLLHRAGAGADIPVGTPVAGRTDVALDQLVGFFINILVLRNDLAGNPTLREVLTRARETALGAYSHQDLPFDRVVSAVRPTRSLSRNPLFSVVVHVREQWPTSHVVDIGEERATTFTALEPTFDMAHADLSFNFFATDDAYTGSVMYRPELYRHETIERLVRWLLRVLSMFADSPDIRLRDASLSDDTERQRILEKWGCGEVFVLDDALNPVPVGVVGEVYRGGEQARRGNCQHAAATAARFVANPYADTPGARLYSSGERARWTDDGRLELIERTPRQDATKGDGARAGIESAAVPAQSHTERWLADAFEHLLGVADVGCNDDFFMLGGDSILAVQLAARARDEGLALRTRMIFEYPTLEQLAAAVDAAETMSDKDDVNHEPMSTSGLSDHQLAALTTSWNGSCR